MAKKKEPQPPLKRVVRLKPSSYQPCKAELEEDMRVDASPEDLLRAAVADVKVKYEDA